MKITTLAYPPENIEGWNYGEEESGNPGVMLFANAVQVWAIAQDRDVTCQDAALTFNVDPGLIREAVNYHPWMFLGPNDTIEHDGE